MNRVKGKINEAVRRLIEDFSRFPDKYLTENDVRCQLVYYLMQYSEFSSMQDTGDGSKSISLHTEVRWHGESGKLKWRSDIVIIDVSSLRVKIMYSDFPAKVIDLTNL